MALAVADVEATLEELKAAGVQVLDGPDETPLCYIASVLDPDGNTLVIHQRKDGSAG